MGYFCAPNLPFGSRPMAVARGLKILMTDKLACKTSLLSQSLSAKYRSSKAIPHFIIVLYTISRIFSWSLRFSLLTIMAESRPFIFSSTTDSSSAPVQSNVRKVRKFHRKQYIEAKTLRNQNKSSVNPPNLTCTVPTQSTEPVNNFFSAKPSITDPGFSIQFPSNPSSIQIVHGPSSFVASANAPVVDAAASSSSLPCQTKSMPEQSLIVVSRILNGIAQSPHFYQLKSFSELTRKSLISGWDHVFEKTVEELQFLQVDHFWVKAKELWKTMEELQSMGYDVIMLRRRLVELTDVLMGLKLAQMEIKWLRMKAENHRLESSRLEGIALRLQEMAKEEKESGDKVVLEVAKKEIELPKFDSWFAKLTKDPL